MEKLQFTKLNGTNYQIWKFKMEMLLIDKEVWETISKERPTQPNEEWLKKDGKARALIGLMVEDNQLCHIRKEESAAGAWKALKNHHEKSTLTNKIFLLKRLCRMQMPTNGNMEEHINFLLDLVGQLEALGEKLAEHLVVALLLCSLPDNYNPLITALESRDEKDLTLEMVKAKLINEYKRNNGTEIYPITLNDKENAMKITKGKPAYTKFSCHFCHKKGHFQRDCYSYKKSLEKNPEKPKNEQPRNESQKAKKIFTNNASDTDESDNEEKPGKYKCFMMKNQPKTIKPVDDWYIDSGASSHMCNNLKFFTKIQMGTNHPVELPDGRDIFASGIGKGIIPCINEKGEIQEIVTKNVLYVPELDTNLLSVRKLTSLGFKVNFSGTDCTICEETTIIATGSTDHSNLYRLNTKEKLYKVMCNNMSNCIHKWHRRFGHRNVDAVKKLINHNMVEGMKMNSCKTKSICECCIQGKMTRLPFPESTSKSEDIFDLVHSDVCPIPQVSTLGNKNYVLTFIDDYSHYTKIYLLGHKSEAFEKFKEFHQAIQTQFQKKMKILRSDKGGEYISNEFRTFLKNEGIEIQHSTADTPEQNGVAERKNRYLIEMGRCMLIDSKLNLRYWGEAIDTANYLQNRLPTRTTDKTPYEMLYKKKPIVDHLRIFGCTAYVHIPKKSRRKLDIKAKKMVMVGYSNESKAYRLLDPATGKIVISRDVRFIEENQEDSELNELTEIIEEEQPNPVRRDVESNEIDFIELLESDTEIEDNGNEDQNEESDNTEEITSNTRKSMRTTKGVPPERFKANKVVTDDFEPKTYKEAVTCKNKNAWNEAIKSEMDSLIENETWELSELPPGRKAIGCKWTFKIKRGANGQITRYKSRLVARGFSQKYGEDYDEVFAPVVKQTTIRTLLAIAKKEKLKVRHHDVKTAFLNGDLHEDIYMKQPEGFVEKGKEHLVCHLKKTLYGLKQSARAWNEKINQILLDDGFKRGEADNCLYTKFVNGIIIYLLIFIDDIIMASKNEQLMDQVEKKIGEFVEIQLMGDLQYYLGIAIERDNNGIFYISQKQYILDILKKFRLEDCKTSKKPLDPDSGFQSMEKESRFTMR